MTTVAAVFNHLLTCGKPSFLPTFRLMSFTTITTNVDAVHDHTGDEFSLSPLSFDIRFLGNIRSQNTSLANHIVRQLQ